MILMKTIKNLIKFALLAAILVTSTLLAPPKAAKKSSAETTKKAKKWIKGAIRRGRTKNLKVKRKKVDMTPIDLDAASSDTTVDNLLEQAEFLANDVLALRNRLENEKESLGGELYNSINQQLESIEESLTKITVGTVLKDVTATITAPQNQKEARKATEEITHVQTQALQNANQTLTTVDPDKIEVIGTQPTETQEESQKANWASGTFNYFVNMLRNNSQTKDAIAEIENNPHAIQALMSGSANLLISLTRNLVDTIPGKVTIGFVSGGLSYPILTVFIILCGARLVLLPNERALYWQGIKHFYNPKAYAHGAWHLVQQFVPLYAGAYAGDYLRTSIQSRLSEVGSRIQEGYEGLQNWWNPAAKASLREDFAECVRTKGSIPQCQQLLKGN